MELRVLDLDDLHFKENFKAKLVRHPVDKEAEFALVVGSGKTTNFLDIRPQPSEMNGEWRFGRTINVLWRDDPDGEVPFFLREYWMLHIRQEVERFAALSLRRARAKSWRVIDICDPSLLSPEILRMEGFTVYVTRALSTAHSIDKIKESPNYDPVTIRNPEVLGDVLNLTKQYYLRHQFHNDNAEITITLDVIKPEKVFFATVRSFSELPTHYIVKFDHPNMIDSEESNYRQIRESLELHNKTELLKCLYKIDSTKSTGFGSRDILAMLSSRAITPDVPSERLTLGALWPKIPESKTKSLFNVIEPIFDVLEHVAIFDSPELRKGTIEQFYNDFARRLYGFAVSKEYREFQDFLPQVFADKVENAVKYSVRRISLENSASQPHLGLSIQLQGATNQRLRIRFHNFARETSWPSTLVRSNLLGRDEFTLPSDVQGPDADVWMSAVKKLKTRIEHISLASDEDYVTRPELPFSGMLPNPIKSFADLARQTNGNEHAKPLGERKELRWISARVHFDLHLDNILASVAGRRQSPTLIDLASMDIGPIDYDYARMEVRLVLDRQTEKWFSQNIEEEVARIVAFHDVLDLKKQTLNGCPVGYTKEARFIKRLRRKRSQVVKNIDDRGELIGQAYPRDEDALNACLFFEYLSELFQRAAAESAVKMELLWAFVSAAYYLKELRDYWPGPT